MTTTIKVTSHNYPALVTYVDTNSDGVSNRTQAVIVEAEDGEQHFHCTTSRTIEIVDLDYYDPRVLASRKTKGRMYVAPVTAATPSTAADASA